ncbi:MAG: hypothetical protein PHU85_10810 [Phycisphaerae bacterium]|nr:hypothetical protein [Phycisphaerae bacterium]
MADAQPQPWQLQPPGNDGDVLLWPDPSRWAQLAERTHVALSSERTARLLDMTIADARSLARESLDSFAGPKPDASGIWIATGHQTFPYHPGIWAKNCAIEALAFRVGAALNLNVDHDLPRAGPQIAWPALTPDGRLVRRGELELDHAQPFERQPAPPPQQISRICEHIGRDLDPLLTERRTCPFQLDGETPNQPTTFGQWCATMRAAADERIGLRLVETLTSRLSNQDAFLLFAADLIARRESFHPAYNDALREAHELTGHEPATPLRGEQDRIELPLWTLRADRPGRHRLFVSTRAGWVLLSDDLGPIGDVPATITIADLRRTLADAGVQLRPRALTLTLFARLLLTDFFIHGVGGGIYDRATDLLFERVYRLPAPPYAVASATLLLPLDIATATADQLRQARRQLRDMRFNPQRHLPADLLRAGDVGLLVDARVAAVRRNDELRAQRTAAGSRERASIFLQIRRLNEDLAHRLAEPIARQEALTRQLLARQAAGEVASARDFFYGLFPTAKLHRLRETIKNAVVGGQ